MNLTSRLFLSFMILFSVTTFAGSGTSFNNIVFFGDSLSDNGNLYSADFGYLPKSPPYYKGRFSNGFAWSEYTAKYFYDKNYTNSTNFSVGGETAIFHNPFKGFLPYSLGESVDSYWMRTLFRDRAHTLFIIWIGSNDYLKGTNDVDKLTTDVVKSIKSTIESLIYYGGMNFLVINLPDFSRTPYAKEKQMESTFHESVTINNQKLAEAVDEIAQSYKSINIHLFDLNSLFVDMLDNINVYNKRYNLHITDTTTSCWEGGYKLHAQKGVTLPSEEEIYQSLLAEKKSYTKLFGPPPINQNTSSIVPNVMDDKQKAHYISISPDLMETYLVSKSAEDGFYPCSNADDYLFWDHIHPTAVIHQVMGDYINKYISQYYQTS